MTRRPAVTELALSSIVLVLAGGIYLAAHIPGGTALWPAVVLLVLAVGLLGAAGLALWRIPEFAWRTFFTVGGWALLAYVVIAGMIGYVLVLDAVPGPTLVILVLMLAVFAVAVPLILAFTVARYQPPDGLAAPAPQHRAPA